MSLINDLKAKSNEVENTKKSIIEEIKAYFDEYLENRLEKFLEKRIGEEEIKERKVCLRVSFWAYKSGCSTTNFHCGGGVWFNPIEKEGYKSQYYKGIELETLDKEIGDYLSKKLKNKMQDLGFSLIIERKIESRFDYYDMAYEFGW